MAFYFIKREFSEKNSTKKFKHEKTQHKDKTTFNNNKKPDKIQNK